MLRFAIYTSNHGFGHATRMAALAEELNRFGVFVHLLSDRPKHLFANLNPNLSSVEDMSMDFGVRQYSNLDCDIERTKSGLFQLMSERAEILDRETDFIRQEKIDLIIADIPWLAIEVGAYSRIPVFAISNFDWLFIFSDLLAAHPEMRPLLNSIYGLYQRADHAFRLPFSSTKSMGAFRKCEKVGLLARKKDSYTDLRADLGISQETPMLTCAFGGDAKFNFGIDKLCASFPGIVVSKHQDKVAENHVVVDEETDMLDFIQASDILLTKPGYSSFAESVQFGTTLLYHPRKGYPEDGILIDGLKHYPNKYQLDAFPNSVSEWKQVFNNILKQRKTPRKVKNCNSQIAAKLIQRYIDLRYRGSKLISVFDTGSNNMNYLLQQQDSGKIIHSAQISTGLGKNHKVLADGSISVPSSSLSAYKQSLSRFLVYDTNIDSEKRVLATGIHRRLKEQAKIREFFAQKWKMPYQVISASDELELALLAAKNSLACSAHALVVDIGGFSTELIHVDKRSESVQYSLTVGLLTLRSYLSQHSDLEDYLNTKLSAVPKFTADQLVLIGLTGIFLVKAIKRIRRYDPQYLNSIKVSRSELEQFFEDLISGNATDVTEFMVEPDSLDILKISARYIILLLDRFRCHEFLTCYYGISAGLIHMTKKRRKQLGK